MLFCDVTHLLPDLDRIICLFLGRGIELGVIATVAATSTRLGVAFRLLGLCLLFGLLRLLAEFRCLRDDTGFLSVSGGGLIFLLRSGLITVTLQLCQDVLDILLGLNVGVGRRGGLLFLSHNSDGFSSRAIEELEVVASRRGRVAGEIFVTGASATFVLRQKHGVAQKPASPDRAMGHDLFPTIEHATTTKPILTVNISNRPTFCCFDLLIV